MNAEPKTNEPRKLETYQVPTLTNQNTWSIGTGVSLPVGTGLPESEGLQ
jgi:hypothetical protein